MKEKAGLKVLMIGPDRSVHGGISGVVNNYYGAGLDQQIDLCYIGTMVEGSKLRKLLQAAIAYMRFISQLPRYEIVHVNMASDASFYRKSFFIKAAKRAGKKIVIHQHGGDFQGFYEHLSAGRKERVCRVLSMGDLFLVLTPFWKEFFSNMVDRNKIIVFPNGISKMEVTNKEYGQQKLLFLGRICKDKGIGELFSVMPELKQKFPKCQLYLGGIWEDVELRQRAEKLKDCVTYLGWVSGEEKQRYLRECDIFVLPSYFEGQPVSILEAMGYACGIVASRVGGIPHMIADGETGVLVKPKDAESLKMGLEKILSHKELCEKLGEAARQKAEKEFSLEANMERLVQLYSKMLRWENQEQCSH